VEGQGTVFRIRLFLPQVRLTHADRSVPLGVRTGYVGDRRRVWVVDNEEADRGLLVRILEPLGFDVTPLASGLDCLALLRSCPQAQEPHAILMDLAMPGIDGWTTVRTIRQEGLSRAPVAIVSANAFDKGLENDVGIGFDDFIVKPVRMGELLDWLGRRLTLQWIEAQRPVVAKPLLEGAAQQAAGEGAQVLPSTRAMCAACTRPWTRLRRPNRNARPSCSTCGTWPSSSRSTRWPSPSSGRWRSSMHNRGHDPDA
jgi:CheY-like chemotaxis protein